METAELNEEKKRFDPRNINVAGIKARFGGIFNSVLSFFKGADPNTLIKGTIFVFLIYGLAFSYVYFTGPAAIKEIETQMTSGRVELMPVVKEVSKNFLHKDEEHEGPDLLPGLSKYEDAGRLPIIRSKDQLTSFRGYQTVFTFDTPEKRTVVAFMLTDFGLSEKYSNMAIEMLPAEVSFLLSPYAEHPREWISKARSHGHEVWLELPIQSEKFPSSGLQTIFHHQNLRDKATKMRKTLAHALGYVGVGIFLDDTISKTQDDYRKLSDEIYGRGLGVFERNPDAPKTIEASAVTRGAPFIQANLDIYKMKGNNSFQELERIANAKGDAVATVPSYPNAIKNLSMWIKAVGSVDYLVAPVSAIYDLPLARNARSKNNSNATAPSGLKPSDHAPSPEAAHSNHH